MNKPLALGIAAALGLASLPVTAGDTAGMKYVVFPRAEAVWVDRDRNLDDGFQIGLGAGVGVNERWNFEFVLSQGFHDGPASGDGDGDFTAFSLNALRIFYPDAKASPYFLMGAGLLSKEWDNSDRAEDPMVELGVGLLIDAFERADGSRKMQIRPEIRSRWDIAETRPGDSTFNDFIAGVSLQYAFGPPRVEPAPVAAPEPAPEPPPPPPPPPPVDTDGDGVYDDQDRCPNTTKGTKVDEIGCFVEATLNLQFEFDSAELTADDKRQLDGALAQLKNFPADIMGGIRVQIAGHTDSRGRDAYNQGLSERRAASTRDYLAAGGFPAAQMSTVGFGETRPVASNDTDEGRAQNRRVVITATR